MNTDLFFEHFGPSKLLKLYLSNKKLLEQAPEMKRMEFGKQINCPLKDKGYRLSEGVGRAVEWTGEIMEELRQTWTDRPLYRLSYEDDGFEMVYEPGLHGGIYDEEATHAYITCLFMENPNYGRLARHLKNADDLLFQKQGHMWAYARADIPNDDRPTWSVDRRGEAVVYREGTDNGKPIKVSRLTKFWANFPRVIPRKALGIKAEKEGELVWMSQAAVNTLHPQQLEAVNEKLHTPRRWSLKHDEATRAHYLNGDDLAFLREENLPDPESLRPE
jgi:hypothetical protein